MDKLLLVGNNALLKTKIREQLETVYSSDNIEISEVENYLNFAPKRDCVVIACLTMDSNYLSELSSILFGLMQMPVVVITDVENSELTINSIKLGVQDCLVYNTYDNESFKKTIEYSFIRHKLNKVDSIYLFDYKYLFRTAPIPMWILDSENLRFLEVNNAVIANYGYSNDEILKMGLQDIRPEEDIPSMLKNFNSKKSPHYDAGYWQHRRKNGEIFWVHVYSQEVIFDGKKARFSFIVDVNEKITAEKNNKVLAEQLKEQKDKQDSLLASVSDAIWSRNADTLEIIYANDSYFRLFGFTREELQLDNGILFRNIVTEDREEFKRSLFDAKITGNAKVEYRYQSKDGKIKTVQANVSFQKGINGNPDVLNGVTVDVTDRIEMENKIRQSEQNLLTTINNTKDLIWSVDEKLEIIFCNKAYEDFIYSLVSIVPKPGDYVLGDWGSEAFKEQRKADYMRALAGESFVSVVEEVCDGHHLCKEFSNNPLIDAKGKIIGINCVARDISEQKAQFLKIQEQNEKLKEIAWIQSHKVRGPVASILGLTELFLIDPTEDEHNSEILENLKIAATNLDNIIKEVVEKTRILNKH